MKRAWLALFLILGMTTARAADAATTYHFTPNLAHEGNGIILTLGGHGWVGLLGINAVVVLAISLCTLYWWRVPLAYVQPPQSEPDVWSFASYNLFGRVYSRGTFLWRLCVKLPKNWRLFCQLVGVVVPLVLMLASALAVFSWFALADWRWPLYRELYHRGDYLFPYALIVPFYVGVTGWFFWGEWRRFRAAQTR